MTCDKCVPNFFEEEGVENWVNIELCQLHDGSMTERLAEALRGHLSRYDITHYAAQRSLLAEYDAARKA